MQQTKRRPFGDLGNTYQPVAAKTRVTEVSRLPESTRVTAPFRIPSLANLQQPAASSSASFAPLVSSPTSPRFDDKNKENHLHVTEYVREIYEHLRKGEMIGRSSPNYMSRVQTDINEKMRTILMDWLVDVHLKFKLTAETLFLAAEIIDRFLDKKVVSRQKLQLVGVVGMLLASKYEEIYPPEVKDFIYIAANTYTREDILRMERLMFATLEFNITVPTIYPFLKRALQVAEADSKTQHLAQCYAELALLDYKMLQHPPSLIGASCVLQAQKTLLKEPWSRALEHYCQYKACDMERCVADIQILAQNAPTQKTQAVRKKYSYAKFGEVSKFLTTA